MSRTEFVAECGARLIAPEIALESDTVRAALRSRDDAAIIAALDGEF